MITAIACRGVKNSLCKHTAKFVDFILLFFELQQPTQHEQLVSDFRALLTISQKRDVSHGGVYEGEVGLLRGRHHRYGRTQGHARRSARTKRTSHSSALSIRMPTTQWEETFVVSFAARLRCRSRLLLLTGAFGAYRVLQYKQSSRVKVRQLIHAALSSYFTHELLT